MLHYISEKVIIIIFILFLFFLMKFTATAINNEFRSKIDYILNDINMYMNVVFNFLYINKLFYLNLKSFKSSFLVLAQVINRKIGALKNSFVFSNKVNTIKYSSTELFK